MMRMKLFAGLFFVLLFVQQIQAAEPPIEQMEKNTVRVITYVRNGQAQGSGFVIGNEYIATNNHVIDLEGRTRVIVVLGPNREIEADIEWNSHSLDIAILHLNETIDRPNSTLSPREYTKKGQDVWAVGFPAAADRGMAQSASYEVKITKGILSATVDDGHRWLHQIDAAISGGNSGGPLFNACGEVIGINSQGALSPTETAQGDVAYIPTEGIKHAIVIDHLMEALDSLGIAYDSAEGPCESEENITATGAGFWLIIGGIGLVVVIALVVVYTLLRKKIKAAKEMPVKVDSQAVRRIIQEESDRKPPVSPPAVQGSPRTQVIPVRKGGTKAIVQTLVPKRTGLPSITLKGRAKLIVGRSNCDVIISNPKVSRRHASLHRTGDVIIVEDLGSTNGTFIDGRKIAVRMPTSLEVGKTIAFGSENIIYRVDSGDTQKTAVMVVLVPEEEDLPVITLREGHRVTFGRAMIKNPDISRRHADLWTEHRRVMVEDLGSTNGTYVHGQKLDPKSPMELKKGQRLVFGSEDVVYYIQ